MAVQTPQGLPEGPKPTWWKPAIKPKGASCLNCGGNHTSFDPQRRIAVGFGFACLTRDGDEVWYEESNMEYEACMSGADAEATAILDPEHDWQIRLHGPMRGAVYQRQGEGHWVLIEEDMGFAIEEDMGFA